MVINPLWVKCIRLQVSRYCSSYKTEVSDCFDTLHETIDDADELFDVLWCLDLLITVIHVASSLPRVVRILGEGARVNVHMYSVCTCIRAVPLLPLQQKY